VELRDMVVMAREEERRGWLDMVAWAGMAWLCHVWLAPIGWLCIGWV
jgi:hypothetical protein